MNTMLFRYLIGISSFFTLAVAFGQAPIILEIQDHKFITPFIEIPQNTKVELIIRNLDSTPEEFESKELHREKVIPAKGEVRLFVGPLKPGRYAFMGEFHPESARGELIVH